MGIFDHLLSLFSAHLEEQDGSYVVEIPDRELRLGEINAGETYRVAVLSRTAASAGDRDAADGRSKRDRDPGDSPVREGETREVEIENLGDQGDGITRVERGFVVIVPDTEPGERVTVEITDVRPNVAFAEVVDRQTHVR